ncbi:MAG: epoxyalkane--coenzyme M transferase [Pseudonocardiaceae bacterium]|nr:epoxyalkane--coenzyme M transferase [Pseudonocardiaceae bacterium]
MAAKTRQAVSEIVRKQADHGVTVLNDGEMGKESYSTYVRERLSGFEGESETSIGMPDMAEYPNFLEKWMQDMGQSVQGVLAPPACNGPIAVKDRQQVQTDIDNLKTAGVQADDVFVSAASPGVVALFFTNHHYPNREEYVKAIADAMRHEYEAIAAAGFLVQLDCPDLAMGRHLQFADASLDEFRTQARLNVEALNHATANIDPDQLRMHLCWGNYEGPHHRDVALADIIDIVFDARPNAISLEACNPRHDHEWALFEDVKLPAGKVLMPGVVDSTNNYIEHPELIAQRLVRYAKLVGKENVIASTDCGFGTAAGMMTVDPDISWAKFDVMAEGARLAERAL